MDNHKKLNASFTSSKSIHQLYNISFLKILLIFFTSYYFIGSSILCLLLDQVFDNIIWIVLMFVLWMIGIITTYFRLRHFHVASDGQNIYFSSNNNHTYSEIIPRQNIKGFVFQQTIPKRLLNMVSVEVIYTKNSCYTSSVLCPLVSKRLLMKRFKEILPLEYTLHSLPKHAGFINLVKPSYSLIIVTFIIFYFWPEYWFIPVFMSIGFILYRIFKTKWTKISNAEEWIQVQTGVYINEKWSIHLTCIDKIAIDQSWLQKTFGLASIEMYPHSWSTRAITIDHLPIETAQEFVQILETNKNELNRFDTDKI